MRSIRKLGRRRKPGLEVFFLVLVLITAAVQIVSMSSFSSLSSLATPNLQKKVPPQKGSPLGQNMEGKRHDAAVDDPPTFSETPVSIPLVDHQQNDPLNSPQTHDNHKAETSTTPATTTTVAYAVSFIKCGDFQTHSAGLTDASLVLRHSVHKISKRNPDSGSKYDYKMYAIVHRQAEECSKILQQTGFEVMIVDSPVKERDIQGEHLRSKIKREWCCGADEFIKLYAYTLPEEIIVHVDIDFAFYKPMDDLFDAILYEEDSVQGQAARSRIQLERPSDKWPAKVAAYITRDWPQVAPNKFPPAYQAGFLVARRDPTVFDELVDIITVGNYTDGWGWNTGWASKGYGGYVGAMAMQGLIAYYYDYVRPNTAVELNQCRYNHMGMDVLYRHHPNFRKNIPGVGKCRNGLTDCEDCMTTDMDKIYSVHYTMCRKPWQCQASGVSGGKAPGGQRATAVNTDTVNLDHCLGLVRQWHKLREDFEKQLYKLTKDETIQNGTIGEYRRDVFGGHCQGDGNTNYLLISGKTDTFRRIGELYV